MTTRPMAAIASGRHRQPQHAGPVAQKMATTLTFDKGIPLYDRAPEHFEEYQERARDVFYGRAGEDKHVNVAVNLRPVSQEQRMMQYAQYFMRT